MRKGGRIASLRWLVNCLGSRYDSGAPGEVTGTTFLGPDLVAKRLQPLREVVLSYGVNLPGLAKQTATYVDKILKGQSGPSCPWSSRSNSSW